MRYEDMRRLYPGIEELFDELSGLLHAGANAEMAEEVAAKWIAGNIRLQNRQSVEGKAHQFILAILEAREAKHQ